MHARLIGLGILALVLGGCSGNKVTIPTDEAIKIVAGAATCVSAVNTAANDPACRAPIAPCRDAYNLGKTALEQ